MILRALESYCAFQSSCWSYRNGFLLKLSSKVTTSMAAKRGQFNFPPDDYSSVSSTSGCAEAGTASSYFVKKRKAKNPNVSVGVTPEISTPTKKQKKHKSPPRSSRASAKKKKKTNSISSSAASVARTKSFAPQLQSAVRSNNCPPHTLILGTHPSVKSLERQEYYAHPMNAFWWIVGDCLGFRRDSGISPSTGKPYAFTKHLRHDNVLPYQEQMEKLVNSGFCLWDVIGSCQRPGSLDQDISNEFPNDIRGFCRDNRSIRRIVFASGGTSSKLFVKHFKDWLGEGQLVAGNDKASQNAFSRAIERARQQNDREKEQNTDNGNRDDKLMITLITALSVSPAAATYTYQEKRDFWDEQVFKPGLKDHQEWKNTTTNSKNLTQ